MQYQLTVTLPLIPASEAGEVVSRRLSYFINGSHAADAGLGVSEIEHQQVLDLAEDDVVSVRLVHIGNAGLVSLPREEQFTIADTTPPSQPGPFTVSWELFNPPPPSNQ